MSAGELSFLRPEPGRRLNEQTNKLPEAATPFGEIDDIVELRRMAAYFRDVADKNGARLLVAETSASKNRQRLEQKIRGFSLLARLTSDASATEEPPVMARILAGHLNSMLNMNRTVVLMRDPQSVRFNVLSSAGYADADRERLASLSLDLPKHVTAEHRAVSTRERLEDEDRRAFGPLDIRYFMAIPVLVDDHVMAVIVTGRMREQRPFSPPLEESNLETVSAISGFFGAYLARHLLIERDREQNRDRIAEVERLVTERTAEIERQRGLLDESLRKLHETQQQLIMREKLASLGQLTAGVAHEIQNPLNFINNFSELSSELVGEIREIIDETIEKLDVETRKEVGYLFVMLRSNLDKITLHGKRADSIVRNMLQHSRGDAGDAQTCDLNTLLTESVDFAYHAARAQDPQFNVAITRDLDATVGEINLVPQQISRVFVNLLSNAFYALKKRRLALENDYQPTISISSRRLEGVVEICLRDNGIGIPADMCANIFIPFFTTKPTGEGTGLGLSLSYDIIVNGHGGNIEVESRENQFTKFRICLPL